jgi:hypothetical protein
VPGLTFGGAFVAGSLAVALGTYNRVGNRVQFDINILVTAVGSSVGTAVITGLPYNATGSNFTAPGIIAGGITYTATYTSTIAPVGGGTVIPLSQITPVNGGSGSTISPLTNANFNTGTVLYISGSYSTTDAP